MKERTIKATIMNILNKWANTGPENEKQRTNDNERWHQQTNERENERPSELTNKRTSK